MDIRVNDVLEMKKQHPCGGKTFLVLRSGMDFKLRCLGCGHELMIPRSKAEKAVKKLIRLDQDKKVLGEEKIASGKLSIKVDKKTFSYILK